MTTPALIEDRHEEPPCHNATCVRLRDHIDEKIGAVRREIKLRMASTALALRLAQDVTDEKTKAKEHLVANHEERIAKLEAEASNFKGQRWAIGVGLTILFTLLQLAFNVWRARG
jgi:hypothetical protein